MHDRARGPGMRHEVGIVNSKRSGCSRRPQSHNADLDATASGLTPHRQRGAPPRAKGARRSAGTPLSEWPPDHHGARPPLGGRLLTSTSRNAGIETTPRRARATGSISDSVVAGRVRASSLWGSDIQPSSTKGVTSSVCTPRPAPFFVHSVVAPARNWTKNGMRRAGRAGSGADRGERAGRGAGEVGAGSGRLVASGRGRFRSEGHRLPSQGRRRLARARPPRS